MEENKVHFRHLMLFYYRKGKNATQATNKICTNKIFMENELKELFARFAKCRAGDFDLKVLQKRASKLFSIEDDQIKTLIENNWRYTTRELAEMLKILKTIIHEHLVKLDYVNR